MSASGAIEVDGLVKEYPVKDRPPLRAVDGISFTVVVSVIAVRVFRWDDA